MHRVFVAQNMADAEAVRLLLEGSDIRCILQDSGTWYTGAPFPSIWVGDADRERANELVDGFRST